jgi:hypothetical protein
VKNKIQLIMKKLINSFLIASTVALTPAIQAQGQHAPIEPAHSPVEEVQGKPNLPEIEAQGDKPLQQTSVDENAENPSSPQAPQPLNRDSTTPLTPETPPESATPEAMPSDDEENEGTPVGQAASEGSKAAKRKQWQNIALATAAVAVAVTALILIANNDGHHHKDD